MAHWKITKREHPAPTPEPTRRAILTDPGFGRAFTDLMITMRYEKESGWQNAELGPRESFQFDPATSVFHYGQAIFEGLKAHTLDGGGVALFRPDRNAERFNASARRMAMPELPEELFLACVAALARSEIDWIPPGDGSLYLRPFMIATEAFLGVRPAEEYLFAIIAASTGGYFGAGVTSISVYVSETFTRAAPGGTGAAKCAGNYASSLLAQAEAVRQGCDQVVFLDAVERKWIDELGGMNIFLVRGNCLVTPALGTILDGVTRDSLIQLAKDEGLIVEEGRYSIEEWRAEAQSGALSEAFACGTAAVVTPISEVVTSHDRFIIGGGRPGPVTSRLRDKLIAIQRGRAPDTHGWLRAIA